jgi:Arc/MetJ-type ribon-helix-helix transcriptional regulator
MPKEDSPRIEAIEALRRLWRDGVDSGEGQPLDLDDLKRRGRKSLVAQKAKLTR